MHVLIIGAAGMLGRKLAERLVSDGKIAGAEITHLTLADAIAPKGLSGFAGNLSCVTVDLTAPDSAASLLHGRPDVIFHLAAIVSGEAETNFEKGYAVNMDGTRALFEEIRHSASAHTWKPRLVFASSIAVFGGDMPDAIGDDYFQTPETSYGTQKAICELLLADYSRRGIFDGIAIRLPTVCVRPGAPNKAASGFFSGIIREPLAGLPAILPVSDEVRHWMASPRATIEFLVHAADMDLAPMKNRRCLTMPGHAVTVKEQIEALTRAAGPKVAALVERQRDPAIELIVSGWARGFDAKRAESLGFVADKDFDEIIRIHIDDELGGQMPCVG